MNNALVVGDIIVDTVAEFKSGELDLHNPKPSQNTTLETKLGGTALPICEAVLDSGFKPLLLCPFSVLNNSDVTTNSSIELLRNAGIELLPCAEGGGIGQSIIIKGEDFERILLVDRCDFRPEKSYYEFLNNLDSYNLSHLLLSGYFVFDTEHQEMARSLIQAFADKPVALDIVPHDLYKNISRETFIELIQGVNYISVERETFEKMGLRTNGIDPALPKSITDILFCHGSTWYEFSINRKAVVTKFSRNEMLRESGRADYKFARLFLQYF